MPWAKNSSDIIWRKETRMSVIASKEEIRESMTLPWRSILPTRTAPTQSKSKDQNGIYTKGTPTQSLSPFPLMPHGYPRIPKLLSTCPHFCNTKPSLTWTVITKRRDKMSHWRLDMHRRVHLGCGSRKRRQCTQHLLQLLDRDSTPSKKRNCTSQNIACKT
jgi:hypothetical protein